MSSSAFQVNPKVVDSFRPRSPPFGFAGLGELTYLRTYSRIRSSDGKKETWVDTVERVVNGTYSLQKKWIESSNLGWDEAHGQRSSSEMFDRMFNMKFLPPGRGLWAMGSPITEQKGLYAALNNCAFVSTTNLDKDLAKPFCFLMDALMCGIGVGFDTKGAGKLKIQKPIGQQETNELPGAQEERVLAKTVYQIEDSREGWVHSIRLLIESYLIPGRTVQSFDVSLIRPAGLPIKGFGGTSSGPGPLTELIDRIRVTLDREIGKPISVTAIMDVCNMIGCCVVSGNVRRSAEIAFGDYKSEEFVNLKNYQLHPERMDYGWASNNSVFADVGMDYSVIGKGIALNGEPGVAWLDNMRRYSRMTERDDKDMKVTGGNPCVTGDTLVLTDKGLFRATNLVGKPFNAVVDGKKYPSTYRGFFCTGQKKVYSVRLTCGLEIRATDNHKFLVNQPSSVFDGLTGKKSGLKWFPIEELQVGDVLLLNTNYEAGTGDEREGWTRGNGTYEEGVEMGDKLKRRKEEESKRSERKERLKLFLEEGRSYEYFRGLIWSLLSYKVDPKNPGLLMVAASYLDGLPVLQQILFSMGVYSSIYKTVVYPPEKAPSVSSPASLVRTGSGSGGGSGGEKGEVLPNYSELKASSGGKTTREISIKGVTTEFIYSPSLSLREERGSGGIEMEVLKVDVERTKLVMSSGNRNYTSTIESISEAYSDSVFDCTVPGVDCFSGNGMLAHNCLEQSLESYELCCLVEVFPNRCTDLEDFKRTLKFAYLYAKTVTLGTTHWPETNRVMMRNRRIGCSLSGIAQFLTSRSLEELKVWCRSGYTTIQHWDRVYSDWFAIPRSIKTTSIKPSGSVSLLAGATPGMHYPISRFYLRRIRISSGSELIPQMQERGYHVEPDQVSKGTSIVEFPIDCGAGIRTASEVSMWEQLSLAAFLQEHWSDNQVSCTVTFDPKTEGSQIPHALNYFQYRLKGVSFLPKTEGGAYPQMPYEEISEAKYGELMVGRRELLDRKKVVLSSAVQSGKKKSKKKVKRKREKKAPVADVEYEGYCDNDGCYPSTSSYQRLGSGEK